MKKLLAGLLGALLLSSAAMAAVNLNSASQAELEALNGIGPSKAKAIIDFRTKNGPFKTVEELNNVPGIGDKTMEMLKKDVSVGPGKPAATMSKPAMPDSKPPMAKPAMPGAKPPATKPATPSY
ncbi:ComEA family DNA-binding protein [Craterilacuibacter sp.]|uniref:ComEA family DNA-binding protein n=1 Tax=Craterilacuibacter sp. TaxID=2870909 RepID=UPI003F32AFEE